MKRPVSASRRGGNTPARVGAYRRILKTQQGRSLLRALKDSWSTEPSSETAAGFILPRALGFAVLKQELMEPTGKDRSRTTLLRVLKQKQKPEQEPLLWRSI
jgi:hypothetical protein